MKVSSFLRAPIIRGLFLFLALAFLVRCATAQTGNGTNPVFVFYLNADSDLSNGPEVYLQILDEVQKHPDWQAWIYYDPPAGSKYSRSLLQLWKDGRLSTLATWKETDSASLKPLEALGANYQRLSTLDQQQESRKYKWHFIYWGHGFDVFGTKGTDLSHFESRLSVPKFREALESFEKKVGKLNTLVFDACVMGTLENLVELKGLAQFYVVAPQLMTQKGLDFSTLSLLDDNPTEFAQANSDKSEDGSVIGRKFLSLQDIKVDPGLELIVDKWVEFLRSRKPEALRAYRSLEKELAQFGGGQIGAPILKVVEFSNEKFLGAGILAEPIKLQVVYEDLRIRWPTRIESSTGDIGPEKWKKLKLNSSMKLSELVLSLR